MGQRKYHLHDGRIGSALAVRVTSSAMRNEIYGIREDGMLKIHLTSIPEDDKTNRALVVFLSDILQIPRSCVEIVAGHHKRNKLVSILDIDMITIQERITAQIS